MCDTVYKYLTDDSEVTANLIQLIYMSSQARLIHMCILRYTQVYVHV